MISWIQRYFQHHFRIVFGLVLLGTIVGFIIAFAPGSSLGRGGESRTVVTREFFGYNLGSQDDEARLYGDANLSATLLTGSNSIDSSDLQNYAFQRAAALAVADQLHLPAATEQEITDFIKGLRAFSDEDGQFDVRRYETFRDSLKTNPRLTEAMVHRVLADDVRAAQIKKIIAGPGYVLPVDVKTQLDRADSVWTLGVATADYASFKPTIPVTDLALTRYFEENSVRYTIPARVVTTCAYFPASAYVGSVTVTDDEVRAYYSDNPGRWTAPAAKPGTKPDPAAGFAAVRPQVEAALKLERAKRAAAKVASDFSYALYESKAPVGSPAFDAVVAAQHVTLKPLAPFTREDGPAEFGGSPEIADEAFKLGEGHAGSDALAAPEGAVVLFWKETLPPRQPLLAEIRAKVTADYTDNEKRKLFVETGRTLRGLFASRLKAGDTFAQAVAAAGSATSAKLTVRMLPPFTRRDPAKEADPSILSQLDLLQKGQVSDMSTDKDGGVFIYAADKKLPDLSETGSAYASMRAQLASINARIGASSYLAGLVAQELKKSEPPVK